MKKALLVATVQSHIAQFHRPLIRVLKAAGYEVHVAARDNLAEKNGLTIKNIDKKFNVGFERSPFNSRNLKAYQNLKQIIENGNYDIISCNTPVGGLVTRIAARTARKKGAKVYYTAHGFHFYQGAPKKNWIIYYPIEKYMAHLTDVLITITNEDYQLAKKKFQTEVRHIHGVGVDEDKYLSTSQVDNKKFRKDMGYNNRFVVLCTGELNANKNQITIIRSIHKLVAEYPDILLLLAGNGPKETELREEIHRLKLESNVHMLGYRTDLNSFLSCADLVVSMSFREGLPLNIIEAMINRKPIIVSNNRGHRELISDGNTGFIIDAEDVDALNERIRLLRTNTELRAEFYNNLEGQVTQYLSQNVMEEIKKIYEL